ncbi:hypothetical protein PMIN01_08270 [Paraphaeosphaeria minitans]|uniref:Uncharacterized protein n=1 Tax=Paraphaeosphaeria minitans TaxID=565426 RepID=A0A9P6KPC2_9PLEO|nr:hypothetical protein PMIN01_08270 [Paraphaeosphaeria minitans]
MAQPQTNTPALYRLPPELLLQITDHLRPKTASDLVCELTPYVIFSAHHIDIRPASPGIRIVAPHCNHPWVFIDHLSDTSTKSVLGDQLSTLKIKLEHDSYCLIHSPTFDAQLLVDQLSILRSTLKVLEIDLDPLDDTDEWDYVLTHCKNMSSPMDKFKNLELLMVPQEFLFSDIVSGQKIMPSDLPKKLRRLDTICPDEDIIPRAKYEFTASIFSTKVKPVWPDMLSMCEITSYVVDLTANTTKSLPTLYEDDPGESDDQDDDSEHELDEYDEKESDSRDSEDETDEDMPDLEYFEAVPGVLIDDMD